MFSEYVSRVASEGKGESASRDSWLGFSLALYFIVNNIVGGLGVPQ